MIYYTVLSLNGKTEIYRWETNNTHWLKFNSDLPYSLIGTAKTREKAEELAVKYCAGQPVTFIEC